MAEEKKDDPPTENRNYNTEDGFIVMVGDEVSWDGELRGLMLYEARRYAKKFKDEKPHKVEDLPPNQWQAAYTLLKEAVDDDVPLSEEEFKESLHNLTVG